MAVESRRTMSLASRIDLTQLMMTTRTRLISLVCPFSAEYPAPSRRCSGFV